MNESTRVGLATIAICLSFAAALPAAEPAEEIQLDAPEDWKGERIKLPPSFAPNMKLKGIEEIRFAPGMFEADSDSFFSYLFVFQLETEPQLTREVIESELLVYYRGLATAVLKGRNITVDTTKFTLRLKPQKAGDAKDDNSPRYVGDLAWLEPFVTQQSQTLHLEVDAWTDSQAKQNYLFVCVSPQDKKSEIWKTMRELRAAFLAKVEN